LILGKALRIEGGKVEMEGMRQFKCQDCQHTWELPKRSGFGGDCPEGCPGCGSANFRRENCGGKDGGGGQGGWETRRKRCCHRGG
jgi:Zn finger protein HypA/HybF involved in hydrogenase expression